MTGPVVWIAVKSGSTTFQAAKLMGDTVVAMLRSNEDLADVKVEVRESFCQNAGMQVRFGNAGSRIQVRNAGSECRLRNEGTDQRSRTFELNVVITECGTSLRHFG